MSEFIKIVLSLSVSGTLLFLVILGLKPLYKNKFSRCWQYYIWIIVVLRFLLPFTPDTTIVGSLFEKFDTTAVANQSTSPKTSSSISANVYNTEAEPIQTNQNFVPVATHVSLDISIILFFIWSALALVLFVRKITVYQGFIQYIKAGNTEVFDIKTLNLLSDCKEKLNIKTRVELSCHSLIASPIMIGFFRPRIILPIHTLDDKELSFIFVHELIHYKQRDMFYKWLIQIVVCVHWFNPFVYLLEREVNKSCELSCDEKVISILDNNARREYGDTLISFLKLGDFYKSSFASVTLTEGAEQLKERLGAIMIYRKKDKVIRILTGVLTLCIVFLAAFAGGYHVASASPSTKNKIDKNESISTDIEDTLPMSADVPVMETLELKGKTYYLVFNEAQLRAIGTGEYGMDQNYMQQADIYLSADEWIPIGTWNNPFTGTFNGNGCEIIGLTMTDPDAEIIGLFGVARDNAQIYNITLRDCDIMSAGRNAAKKSVGAIVAIAYGGRAYDNFIYPKETDNDEISDGNNYEKNELLELEELEPIVDDNWPVSINRTTDNTTAKNLSFDILIEEPMVIVVTCVTKSGEINMEIKDGNGNKLLDETDMKTETFEIQIDKAGTYTVTIQANNHTGSFQIVPKNQLEKN